MGRGAAKGLVELCEVFSWSSHALFCLQPSRAIPTRLGWSSLRDPWFFQAIRGSGMSLCTLTLMEDTPNKGDPSPAPGWPWVSVSHHKSLNKSSFFATEEEEKEKHCRRKLAPSRTVSQFSKGAVGQGVWVQLSHSATIEVQIKSLGMALYWLLSKGSVHSRRGSCLPSWG